MAMAQAPPGHSGSVGSSWRNRLRPAGFGYCSEPGQGSAVLLGQLIRVISDSENSVNRVNPDR